MSYQTQLPKSLVHKSQEVLGQLGTSRDVLPDMTTKVQGPKVPRSPGTTQDIPGCPIYQTQLPKSHVQKSQEVLGILGTSRDVLYTRHNYQSPMSKSPKKSWDNSGHPRMSYQIMTTKVPGPKVPRSPGNTRDIPGCPIYQTQLPKSHVQKS